MAVQVVKTPCFPTRMCPERRVAQRVLHAQTATQTFVRIAVRNDQEAELVRGDDAAAFPRCSTRTNHVHDKRVANDVADDVAADSPRCGISAQSGVGQLCGALSGARDYASSAADAFAANPMSSGIRAVGAGVEVNAVITSWAVGQVDDNLNAVRDVCERCGSGNRSRGNCFHYNVSHCHRAACTTSTGRAASASRATGTSRTTSAS